MSHLTVTFLGTPRISGPGGPLTMSRRQPLAVLAILALTGRPVSRDELVYLLWADVPQPTARQRLRRILANLRHAIEQIAAEDIIQARTDGIVLDLTRCSVDALDFLQLTREIGRVRGPAAYGPAKQAVALYNGPLLDGFAPLESSEFDQWISNERTRFENLYHETLSTLITAATASGALSHAIEAAERLRQVNPLDERAYRTLMRLYAAAGQRTIAIQQFERCQRSLEREWGEGVEPMPETRALYEALLRGQPLSIHDEAANVQRRPDWRLRPAPPSACVGRAAEIDAVRSALIAGLEGYSCVVCVSGPAGIGKTRLLREAVDGLPAAIWLGGGSVAGESAPYAVALTIIRAALDDLNYQRRTSSTATQSHSNTIIFPDLPDVWLAEVSRLLPEVREYRPDLSSPPALPPEQARARLFEALTRLFRSLVESSGGALLILDDLGEVDSASLAWLGTMIQQIEARSLGIAVAYRRVDDSPMLAQWLDDLARLQMRRDIHLSALTPDNLADMLQQLQVPDHLTQPLAHRLWNETGGTPFFVLETMRVIRERGITLEHLPEHEPLPLPSTVQEVIRVRIQSLDDTTRQVLDACAVAGRTFAFDLVKQMSLRSDAETAQALDQLLTRQFLLEEGTSYRFSHAHIAEVAYTIIGSAMRRVLHQRVADILHTHLQRTEMRSGVLIYADIAHHLEHAHKTEEAATFWLTAGQHAWELFAVNEALNAFMRGLACIPAERRHNLVTLRFDLLSGQEDVLHHLGSRAEQRAALATMENLVAVMSQEVGHPPSDIELAGESAALVLRQIEVAWRQGRFFIALNQWQQAEVALRRSVEVRRSAHMLPDETSLCLLATALIHQRRGSEAQAVAEEALQQAVSRNDASAQAGCLLTLSGIASELEDLNTSERYLQMALEQAQAATDPVTQANLVVNLAAIEFQRGRFEAALHHAQKAVHLHHAQANREGEARSHVLAAICLARLLRYSEALDAYACARESYRAIQHTQGLAAATINAAVLAGRLGDLERSLELGHEAHALFTKIGDERGICGAASNVGGVLFFLGQSKEAEQWLCEALERATTLALPMQQSSALLNLGGALLQQERIDEAREMLNRGLSIRQTMGHVDVCATLAYLALVYLRVSDLESAETLSRQAVEQLDTTDGVEHPQQVFFARAQVLQLLGRTTEAKQALLQAYELLQQVLDSLETTDEQQRYLRAFAFNRDLMAALQKNHWPNPPRLA